MVVDAGKFILMCFGNLIWPGLGSLFIVDIMGRMQALTTYMAARVTSNAEDIQRGTPHDAARMS